MDLRTAGTNRASATDWQVSRRWLLGIAESAVLGCLEPNAISSCYEDELPRIRKAIQRARNSGLARFRGQVSRNAFLCGCLDYTKTCQEEHLLIGYGFRHGPTTKVESLHHAVGGTSSVSLPINMAHAMWEYYRQHDDNELLIFHNHSFNPLNFLFDNPPLPSTTDRLEMEARALNAQHIVRRFLGQGRILFYLGQNGYVKEFRLPSLIALLEQARGRGA